VIFLKLKGDFWLVYHCFNVAASLLSNTDALAQA